MFLHDLIQQIYVAATYNEMFYMQQKEHEIYLTGVCQSDKDFVKLLLIITYIVDYEANSFVYRNNSQFARNQIPKSVFVFIYFVFHRHTFMNVLNVRFLEELEEGVYIQQTIESVLQNEDGKQLTVFDI